MFMFVVCCVLFVACCVLFGVRCLSCLLSCGLVVVCGSLFVVRCLLSVVCCFAFGVWVRVARGLLFVCRLLFVDR